MPPDNDDITVYEVRLTEPAEIEVEAAYLGRMQFGQKPAERWYAGFLRELDRLTTFPRSHPLAPENDPLGGGVRQMLYGKGTSAYRILFRVIEPQGEEPGIVRVLHVRHASQRRLGESDVE